MEERVIFIRSAGDAQRHLRALQKRTREINQPTRIVFDGWPSVHFNVKGKRYKGSLPTPLMKSLYEYQLAINRIYANVAYRSLTAKSLDESDKRATELNFKIEEGSSDGLASAWKFLNDLGDKLVSGLTPKDKMKVLLGLALLVGGYTAMHETYSYLETTQTEISKQKVEDHRHELEMGLLRDHEQLDHANEELNEAILGIVRSVPDATSLKVGVKKYNRTQIEKINENARATTVKGRADGNYVVKGLWDNGARWVITLVSQDGETEFKTDLYKSEDAFALMPSLQQSFGSQTPLYLNVEVRRKGDQITQARLVSPVAPSDDTASN